MGSLFRSEDMRLCQLFLQTEAAYACVSELGELGLVQFKDLNADVNAFQRKFVSEVRRCEEMERKLRYMEKELLKDGMKVLDFGDPPPIAPQPKEIIDLEATFEKIDQELRSVNSNYEALKQNSLELMELREVLHKAQYYFTMYGPDNQPRAEGEQEDMTSGQGKEARLGYMVGTIGAEKVPMFERVMSFFTHNNVFLRTSEVDQLLEDPVTGDQLKKHVFIVFFQGDNLGFKVKKVCDGLRCSVYPVSEKRKEREDMIKDVDNRLQDMQHVLSNTQLHRQRILENAQKELRAWTIKVEKIKAIFHTLNMFKSSQNSLIAECWCPIKALGEIKECLTRGERISGSTIPTVIQPMLTGEVPPTYFNCNRFVKGFQSIVDAYGVATFGEVNPAPYTCITFPFLFAVMFGDAGHGLIMFLFGAWMCVKEKALGAKKSDNEIWNTFFSGRYIIMMMGLFSTYTGLIYNDCFARALNIFGSEWNADGQAIGDGEGEIQLNPGIYHNNGSAYFLGVDPIWQSATNKISFLNSLKMKMAIILGVTHMLFGVCMSLFNHVHFKRKRLILLQYLPEMLFLGCLFGYLVALVIYKWLTYDATTSICAPPLLIHYINMFMFTYKSDDRDCHHRDPQATFYDGQQITQTIMFLLAILSVPVLLIARPVVHISIMNKQKRMKAQRYHTAASPLISNEVAPNRPGSGGKSPGLTGMDDNHADQNVSLNSDEDSVRVVHRGYQEGSVRPASSSQPAEMELGEVNLAFQNDNGFIHDAEAGSSSEHDEHEESVSEILIENVIETIEFCLGCISHTASYLRLWALSLAHAQLSEVLWTMVMHMGFTIGGKYLGGVILVVIFFFWANLTVGILLLMEGLSAFLHTLRLHWVEFQSKFYKGDGYNFAPFNFKHINEMESLEEML